jgi:ParB family chromosome partitioning protein
MGHAKVILSLEGRERQIGAAREIVKRALSVRASETFCRKFTGRKAKTRPGKTPEMEDLEQRLTRSLGTKVRVHHGKKRGRIEIEYYSLDELDRLLELFLKLDVP